MNKTAPLCLVHYSRDIKARQAHLAGEHPALLLLILADAHLNLWFRCKMSLVYYILYFVEVCLAYNIDRWREGCVPKLLRNLKDHAKAKQGSIHQKSRANHLCPPSFWEARIEERQ